MGDLAEVVEAHPCAVETWRSIYDADVNARIAWAWIRESSCALVIALVYFDEARGVWRWSVEGVDGDAKSLADARSCADAHLSCTTRQTGSA